MFIGADGRPNTRRGGRHNRWTFEWVQGGNYRIVKRWRQRCSKQGFDLPLWIVEIEQQIGSCLGGWWVVSSWWVGGRRRVGSKV